MDIKLYEVDFAVDTYIHLSNSWAVEDNYKHLINDTRLIFDKSSPFECLCLLKCVSIICNNLNVIKNVSNHRIIMGCLHYIMSMTKYQASGVDPRLFPATDLGMVGVFLANSPQASHLRRMFVYLK